METFFIPNENDVKRWVKEAVQEYFLIAAATNSNTAFEIYELISRKEAAKLLKISLITLTDWMKRRLPFYKQRGRVYFIKNEVLTYIQKSSYSREKLFTHKGHFG